MRQVRRMRIVTDETDEAGNTDEADETEGGSLKS